MSCGHGCGHGHGYYPSADVDWYGRPDWSEAPEFALRRRDRAGSRIEDELSADGLETRLSDLHEAIRRLETELADLRAQGPGGTGRPPAKSG